MPKRTQEQSEEIGRHVRWRWDQGVRYAADFRDRIDLLAPYIEPTRSNVVTKHAPGEALLSRMYDSEGISSADLAVRQIGVSLHGPGSNWFGIEDENPLVNDDDEGREWYEDCRARMYRHFTHGGFYPESYESDMDWMGFGTGCMMSEKMPWAPGVPQRGFPGIRFLHHKAGRFICFENGQRIIDEIYFDLTLQAKAAVDLWGIDNLPEGVKQDALHGRVAEHRFIHGIYPRKDRFKAYGNKALPWASCYVHYQTNQVVYESGYEEFPAVVPRWSRCHGEPYGRGLGEIALNDLITLNAAKKLDLEAMALGAKPALAQRHDAVIGAKRFSPWGVTIVRVAPGESVTNAIAPINTFGNYQFSQIKEEELRKSIRKIFYADILEQLMALEGQQEMRVYVFQQKQNIVQKLLGPTAGRWESEFGIPIVGRVWNMLYRAGAFAPPPDIIMELGGQPRVRFESPLARAQRTEEMDAMNGVLQDLMPIVNIQSQQWKLTGQQPPDWILDGYNWDKYRNQANKNRGIPALVTYSTRELMAIRQSRAEAEQQKQQAQGMMQAAQAAGQAAPMVQAVNDAQNQQG